MTWTKAFIWVVAIIIFAAVEYYTIAYFKERKVPPQPTKVELSTDNGYFVATENGEKKVYHLLHVKDDPLCNPCHSQELTTSSRRETLLCPSKKVKTESTR